MKREYVLRNVIGKHYLVCLNQKGSEYVPPLEINDVGVEIYQAYQQGKSEEKIAEVISSTYGITISQALADCKQFIQQMENLWISY